MPDEDQLRVSVVVLARRDVLPPCEIHAWHAIADVRVKIAHREAGNRAEPTMRHHAPSQRVGARRREHGLRTPVFNRVEEAVRDLRKRLVPTDAVPLAFAALARSLERIEHALFGGQHLIPTGPLLTAHGVEVRHAFLDDGELRGLLLELDLAVSHIHLVRTGADGRIAIHRMAALYHIVPLPPVAVGVFGRPVRVVWRRWSLACGSRHDASRVRFLAFDTCRSRQV